VIKIELKKIIILPRNWNWTGITEEMLYYIIAITVTKQKTKKLLRI